MPLHKRSRDLSCDARCEPSITYLLVFDEILANSELGSGGERKLPEPFLFRKVSGGSCSLLGQSGGASQNLVVGQYPLFAQAILRGFYMERIDCPTQCLTHLPRAHQRGRVIRAGLPDLRRLCWQRLPRRRPSHLPSVPRSSSLSPPFASKHPSSQTCLPLFNDFPNPLHVSVILDFR